MSSENENDIKVYGIEKVIVNFALPSDFLYHSTRSMFSRGTYEYAHQSLSQRLGGIYNGKVEKYRKLLEIKQRHGGEIPERVKNVCRKTECGKVRLALSNLR